jgi:hypothetical protein
MTEPSLPSAARVSWFAAASRGRLRVALAAILLVLHWAIPNVWAFEAEPGHAGPGYSQAQLGAPPGTLPRLMPRTQCFEAGLSDPQRDGDPPVEAAKAFHIDSIARVPAADGAAGVPQRFAMALAAATAASFEARGPPSPQA